MKREELTKYCHHLHTCNIMQDWSEAESAMTDTPERFRDEGWQAAYEEIRILKNKCTCGLDELLSLLPPLPPAEGAENIRQLLLGWEHYKRDHFRESEALDVEAILMSEYSQIAAQPQPTAEGAEEILEDIAMRIDARGVGNNRDAIKRFYRDKLNTLATIHAQKIAEKMVSERWINVEDRLPEKDGKSSIYCLVNSEHDGIVVRPYNEYHKCWDDEDADDYYCDAIGGKITHWMPLPNPPIR